MREHNACPYELSERPAVVRALQHVIARIRGGGAERETVDPEIFGYAVSHTTPPGDEVSALRAETDASLAMPQMAGGIVESRLLEALVVATRARRVLEIGTLTGVSALSMASRLPDGGTVVTLEADPHVAAIARRHFASSRHGAKIHLIEGDARDAVTTLEGPFELVFIDASKHDYGHYYETLLPKLADHGLIVADNVLGAARCSMPAPATRRRSPCRHSQSGCKPIRAWTMRCLRSPTACSSSGDVRARSPTPQVGSRKCASHPMHRLRAPRPPPPTGDRMVRDRAPPPGCSMSRPHDHEREQRVERAR